MRVLTYISKINIFFINILSRINYSLGIFREISLRVSGQKKKKKRFPRK